MANIGCLGQVEQGTESAICGNLSRNSKLYIINHEPNSFYSQYTRFAIFVTCQTQAGFFYSSVGRPC
ncbi:MAG: hypothetical protein C5B59_16560 [Bacteroidetes bacterium]|nr:MAG: hypothetical protein C5B59_16560 [Bacteroidota bacterium]